MSNPVASNSAFLQGFENFTKAGAAKNQKVLKSINSFLNISKRYVEQLYIMGLSLMVPSWLAAPSTGVYSNRPHVGGESIEDRTVSFISERQASVGERAPGRHQPVSELTV